MDDIIPEKSGGSQTQAVGRVAYFNSDEPDYSFSNFTVRLRMLPEVKFKPKYAFHLLNDFYHQGNTFAMQSGMGNIKNLNMTYYMSIQIPDAPAKIQDEIISKCDAIDTDIANASSEISTLKGEISGMPSAIVDAEEIPLSQCIEFQSKRIPCSHISFASYISTDNLLPECKGIVEYKSKPNIANVTEYKTGDILLSNIRPYLQKMWLATFDGGCSPDVLVMRNKNALKFDSSFLYYYLMQQPFFDHIMSDVKGMRMPRGKKETILAYKIRIPADIEIQRDIARKISDLYARISQLEDIINNGFNNKKQIIDPYIL